MMTRIARPCTKCYRTIPADRTRCPWCGDRSGEKERAFSHADERLAYALLIIMFFGLAAGGYWHRYYYKKFVYPNEMVPVKTGSFKRCPVNGIDYDLKIETIAVPRSDEGKYSVKKIESCPPEVFLRPVNPGIKDMRNKLVDVELLRNDERARAVKRIYPNMNRVSAWYVGRRILALGMNKQQVLIVLGRPTSEEYFARDGKRVERWGYGDPVYGLAVSNRYADFQDGKLAAFSAGSPMPVRNRLELVIR
ncbi:MAG: hypothetical protein WCX65_01375 [bacterium]